MYVDRSLGEKKRNLQRILSGFFIFPTEWAEQHVGVVFTGVQLCLGIRALPNAQQDTCCAGCLEGCGLLGSTRDRHWGFGRYFFLPAASLHNLGKRNVFVFPVQCCTEATCKNWKPSGVQRGQDGSLRCSLNTHGLFGKPMNVRLEAPTDVELSWIKPTANPS